MAVRVADKIKQYGDADFFLMDAEDVGMPNGKSVKEHLDEKGQPNGYASLDSVGKVPASQLPDITITNTYVVSTQAAMLALDAQIGDVAVRTDLSKSFILKSEPATTVTNWQELLTPPDSVISVAGKTGTVVLTKSDVELGNVDNVSDANKPISNATQTALNNKVDKIAGKGLSTEDFTTAQKSKLTGIETGAEVNTVDSVAGKTGTVTLVKSDVGLGNVDNTADSAKIVLSAGKLTTPRKINGVNFDGTSDITVTDSTKEPKITAGTTAQLFVGNKTWKSILTTVQGVLLTGLSVATNSAITASDTIIKALGKLQAQINARLRLTGGTMTGSISMGSNKITSSSTPTTNDDFTNKKYVDDVADNTKNVILSRLSELTMLKQSLNDSENSSLLDSTGEPIFGYITLVEAVERLNEHALLDSTF